jgi:hypothetical protein
MQAKHGFQDPYFGWKGHDYRPISVTTEIVDTDWEEDEILSQIEEDNANSPRVSLNSVRGIANIYNIILLLTCVLD